MKPATLLLSVFALAAVANGQAVAAPASRPLTLWGITMGQATPMWASCPATATVEAQDQAGPCVQPEPKPHSWDLPSEPSPYKFVVVQNLPFASGALQVTLFDKRVDEISTTVPEMLCIEVREAMEKKLGQPTTHTVTPMQNGFGAQWTTDNWTWLAADGTLVQYWQHLKLVNCSLQVSSAASRQRNKPAPVVRP